MAGQNNLPYIINLGNSIIGVALLALPFCFKQCGILLCMLVLFFCTWLTLASCQLLMKAGVASRRKSYEILAFHTHGSMGKLVAEVGMIGMQLGTLIAQVVVIGDLGPAIISKLLGIENTSNLRTFLIAFLCLTVGLPMGLLKNLHAVSRASTVCIIFYFVFVLYVMYSSLPNLWTGTWYLSVNFWRPEGLFQCLPILSFSFGCQTQLFLVYDALPEPSLKAISGVISSAVNLCAVAYLLMGFFGYIAFYSQDIPGDIIAIFPSTFFAGLMKLGFVFSIVITFPVIIFPCRASIHSLIFSRKYKPHDDVLDTNSYMSENQFKIITVCIVLCSMITGILIPNVEFILGINGAIVGTVICYIFPALFFLAVMGSKPDGRLVAQVVLVIGVCIMLVSTFATLSSQDKGHAHVEESKPGLGVMDPGSNVKDRQLDKPPELARRDVLGDHKDQIDPKDAGLDGGSDYVKKNDDANKAVDVRMEPPNPKPPDVNIQVQNNKDLPPGQVNDKHVGKEAGEKTKEEDEEIGKKDDDSVNDEMQLVLAANKAKEKELQEKEKKQDEILAELEKHRVVQEKLIEKQKEVLQELKDHKDSQKVVEDNQDPRLSQVHAPNNQRQQPPQDQEIGINQQPLQPHNPLKALPLQQPNQGQLSPNIQQHLLHQENQVQHKDQQKGHEQQQFGVEHQQPVLVTQLPPQEKKVDGVPKVDDLKQRDLGQLSDHAVGKVKREAEDGPGEAQKPVENLSILTGNNAQIGSNAETIDGKINTVNKSNNTLNFDQRGEKLEAKNAPDNINPNESKNGLKKNEEMKRR